MPRLDCSHLIMLKHGLKLDRVNKIDKCLSSCSLRLCLEVGWCIGLLAWMFVNKIPTIACMKSAGVISLSGFWRLSVEFWPILPPF